MAKKQNGTDLDDVADNSGGKRARIDDKVTLVKFPEGKWLQARLFGKIYTYAGYWVKTKKKDGKAATFYVPCPSYDPQTQQRDSSIYDPWRDLEAQQIADEVEPKDRLVRFAVKGYINGIVRSAEKDRPRKVNATKKELKTHFKDKDSESWTPVYAFPLGKAALGKLKEQGQLNTVEIKGQTKNFPLTHEKFGRDVRIKYDSTKAPADQYQVVMGDKRMPMTEEQQEYLIWDLSELEEEISEAEVKRDFESWASRNGIKGKKKSKKSKDDEEDDDDFPDDDGDDDEDEPKSKKGKKDKKGKGKKSRDEDEDDEEDDDSDDFDDDEDEDEPKSKKGKKGSKKSKSDDDEDEEDDEDEDEAKSKKSKKAKGKKSRDEDDEDEDDDFEDDDEDDEEEDSKSKKAKGKKSKSDDEDEDDFEDDDEEDEDEPKSKKSKKSVKGKKSKSDDDDEDDFDEDDEEEDEDEDEPKSKKKSKAKGKKSRDDDDEEDDEEDSDDFDDEDEDEEEKPKKSKKKSKGKK